MADMVMTNGFLPAQGYDFSAPFAVANPAKSATLTQIIEAKGVGTAESTIFSRTINKLNKTGNSGGKAEGSVAGAAEKSDKETVKNATEIYKKTASISGTAKAINQAAYAAELNDRVSEMKEDVNYGVVLGTYSETDPRKMKGLKNFAKTTVKFDGETLDEVSLDKGIQALGTTVDVRLAVNPVDMLAVQRALLGDKANIVMSTTQTDAGIYVTTYHSAQGVTVKLYAESALSAGNYLLYDMDKVEYLELVNRGIHVNPIGYTGDFDSAEIVLEASCICNPYSVVRIEKNAG